MKSDESWMVDHRFRAPRVWTNRVLAQFSTMLRGSVVNVSGWRDSDKEGGTYRANYFTGASEYVITNWRSDARGWQGDIDGEVYLDLEAELPPELSRRFDVVFNHTTLEHVFDVFTAFGNLCELSRDVVIVVVPFMQEQHGAYGDYWRFTPWAVKRLFERNGLSPVYINFNDSRYASIYVFGIATRTPNWASLFSELPQNKIAVVEKPGLGAKRMTTGMLVRRSARRLGNLIRR